MASKITKSFEGLVDKNKRYSLKEAIGILKKAPKAKFDESVDLAIKLDIDPKQSDQMVRGTVVLPHGTGKTKRVAVFCKGEAQHKAKEAGADHVGAEDLIEKVGKGFFEFDVCVASPEMMRDLSKLGKVLGPRGLMPNPKAGTVVQPDDVGATIRELRGGRVEYRVDRTGNLHIPIGKVSFAIEQLLANMAAIMEAIVRARPAAVRGQYIKRVVIASTMGPGVKVDINLARDMHPA